MTDDTPALLRRIERLEADMDRLCRVREALSELIAAHADVLRLQSLTLLPSWAPGLPAALVRWERAWAAVVEAERACQGIRRGTP